MWPRRNTPLRALLLALLLATGAATALLPLPVVAAEQRLISKAEAAALAQQRYGGEVLKVSRNGNNYQVRLLLPNGRVRSVTVDGVSGRVGG